MIEKILSKRNILVFCSFGFLLFWFFGILSGTDFCSYNQWCYEHLKAENVWILTAFFPMLFVAIFASFFNCGVFNRWSISWLLSSVLFVWMLYIVMHAGFEGNAYANSFQALSFLVVVGVYVVFNVAHILIISVRFKSKDK